MNELNRGYLHPFWDGALYYYGVGELPRTLTELAICQLSAKIRKTDTWWRKLNDSDTRKRWLTESAYTVFSIRTSSGVSRVRLSQRQIEYTLDELQGYAALRDTKYHCSVSCFDRIWETDRPLDLPLFASLQLGLEQLRKHNHDTINIPDEDDAMSINIVDPFHFALVYGRTLMFGPNCDLIPVPRPPHFPLYGYLFSPNFSCLPTLFLVSPPNEALRVKALSYITGIDPTLTQVYADIESALATCTPLFEHVLTDLHRNNPLCHRIPGTCTYTNWDEPDEPEHSDDDEGWNEYQLAMERWALQRPIEYPDVPVGGYKGGLETRKEKISLRGRTIKVILRVTDIHLRPERPVYEQTSWHAEGMRNEHIVACVMQCVSMINITPIEIEFRMPICSPRDFDPGDTGATMRTWGLTDGAPRNQYLGGTTLRPGHSVAFPNIYQHRLSSARLQDDTKEGSMTIMSFFLTDPEISGAEIHDQESTILSTARVPPQQMSWIRRAVEESIDLRVPIELVEKIMEYVEGLMDEEDARKLAQGMREERERFWKIHDERWFSLPFDIWQA